MRKAAMVLGLVVVTGAWAQSVPDRINYQGVLRDAAGAPLNGTYDMVFRFYDAATLGNEILLDRHENAGSGAVVVTGGLLQVELGGGAVSDGSAVLPGDPYGALAKVFDDFTGVWMEIQVGQSGAYETLSPRTHVISAPYAMRAASAESADSVGGVLAGNFLDTSVTAQTKSGALRINGSLTAGGNNLLFTAGASLGATSSNLLIIGGDANSDDLLLRGGNGSNDGAIEILGGGTINLRAPAGGVAFMNDSTGVVTATLNTAGTFTATDDLVAGGGDVRFGALAPGAGVNGTATGLTLTAGDESSDDVVIRAGDGINESAIEILGDGDVNIRSDTGIVNFTTPAGGSLATLLGGTLTLEGDLDALGAQVHVGTRGARLSSSDAASNLFSVYGGSFNDDSLALLANSADAPPARIYIRGSGGIELRPTSGLVEFWNSAGALSATLVNDGTFSANQLVALGYKVHLGAPGSTWIERNPSNDHVFIARDHDNNHLNSQFLMFTDAGSVMQMRIEDGDEAPTSFDGPTYANGLDYAEAFRISDPTLHAGEVVGFDPAEPGLISRASEPYSRLIAGVISGKPGFVTGNSFDAEEAADPALAQEMKAAFAAGDFERGSEISLVLRGKKEEQQRPVALAGRLPVKVDASYGPIKPGDHLTSSKTPGHAMAMHEPGPSLGVALEGWEGPGPGVVLAFVQRGHYTPPELLAEAGEAQRSLAAALDSRTADPVSGVQSVPANLQVVLDSRGGEEARFSVFRDGAAAEPRAEVFRVDERGNVWAQGTIRPRAMDLAEAFALSDPVEPGDVLVADRENPGRYMRSSREADPAVVGVVASDPGVLLGGDVSRVLAEEPALAEALAEARRTGDRPAEQAVWADLERRFAARHAAVALSGTVPVKVDAAYGAIVPGDLLIASPTPGHAMRAPDPAPQGAVIGKALEAIDTGTGLIRMIVTLR